MLIINISPLYLRCGLLLSNSKDSTIKDIEINKDKFQYINSKMIIDYNKSMKLLLFQINYFEIDNFMKSPDYKFCTKNKIIENLNNEEKEVIDKLLTEFKDNNNSLSRSILQDKNIQKCYYCGQLTGKKEYIIFKIFQKKCQKLKDLGDLHQLSILGIDYINNNIENSFFDLPKESVNDLIIVGKGKKCLNEKDKNTISLQNKLYPYLLSTGDEGISIYRVDSINSYKKLGYNTLGPTTLWSLLNLTYDYKDDKLALNEAMNGNNRLIDFCVGDIYGGDYGGVSLYSDLIASSFSKMQKNENLKDVDKKDVAKALLIFYGFTYAQVATMVSIKEKLGKNIIGGDNFGNLELMSILQNCLGVFTTSKTEAIFNEYSNYFEIFGMIVQLEKNGYLD